MGQATENVEDEHLPAGVLQLLYRLAQPPGLLLAEHDPFRSGGGVGQLQFLVWGVCITAPPAAFLEPSVFADAAQPGVEAAAALEAVDVQKCLIKCLLQELLRPMGIPGQGEEEPVDRFSLGFVEVVKSGHGQSSFPMMP